MIVRTLLATTAHICLLTTPKPLMKLCTSCCVAQVSASLWNRSMSLNSLKSLLSCLILLLPLWLKTPRKDGPKHCDNSLHCFTQVKSPFGMLRRYVQQVHGLRLLEDAPLVLSHWWNCSNIQWTSLRQLRVASFTPSKHMTSSVKSEKLLWWAVFVVQL